VRGSRKEGWQERRKAVGNTAREVGPLTDSETRSQSSRSILSSKRNVSQLLLIKPWSVPPCRVCQGDSRHVHPSDVKKRPWRFQSSRRCFSYWQRHLSRECNWPHHATRQKTVGSELSSPRPQTGILTDFAPPRLPARSRDRNNHDDQL